jgi:hypothetical protein
MWTTTVCTILPRFSSLSSTGWQPCVNDWGMQRPPQTKSSLALWSKISQSCGKPWSMRYRSCHCTTSAKQNLCVDLHTILLIILEIEVGSFLQIVRGLEQELEVVRDQVLLAATGSGKAGGRFAFKRTAPAVPKTVDVASITAVPTSEIPSPESRALSIAIADRTYQYLCAGNLPAEQLLARGEHDLSLSNLSHCIVDFVSRPKNEGLGRIRALHAHSITRCVLIMPIIEGSALLHEFKDCIIVLGCHQVREASSSNFRDSGNSQFRMHNSNSVDVYLHVTSKPIIERCTVVRFAPYTLSGDPGSDEVVRTLHTSTKRSTYASPTLDGEPI